MLGFFADHFWQYFFLPLHGPWYTGNVWGNVVAVLPLAVLGFAGFWWHHSGVHRKLDLQARELEKHGRHLKALVEALDPETPGGIADVLDRLDPATPGGIKVIVDALAKPK